MLSTAWTNPYQGHRGHLAQPRCAVVLGAEDDVTELDRARARLEALSRLAHPVHSLARVLSEPAVIRWCAKQALRNRGARTPGVDGVTGHRARQNYPTFTGGITATLASESFKALVASEFPKPDGGVRTIMLPTLEERAIGRGIGWVLNSMFDGLFHPGVLGCRPGRGPHDALALAVGLVASTRWLLKLDFRDFFGSVEHELVMQGLARRIDDKKLARLVRGLMRRVPVGVSVPRTRGIPQGCPASPVLANIAALPVDEWISGQGLRFVRYLDDILVFFPQGTRSDAERFVLDLKDFLSGISLELSPQKTVIATADEGVPFLGHLLFKTPTGEGCVRPSAESVQRFRANMHERANALSQSTNSKEYKKHLSNLYNTMRGFTNYYLPYREAQQVAGHAFLAAVRA